jgi:glycosyltransferase involved in cell wall biosynthesis
MRVLLVTDWNRGRGGAEAYIAWLRDGLRAAGDETRLLTSSAGTAGDGAAEFVAYGAERVAAQAFLQILNPFAVARAREALREFRPDVVLVNMFAHHLSPAILAALRPVPSVLLVSDYKCVCPLGSKLLGDGTLCRVPAGWVCYRGGCLRLPHWLRDQVRYAFIRSELRHVGRVVACSRWVQRELASGGIDSEVVLWPVPAPGQGFRHIPGPDAVFVYCGRLDAEKGVAGLLRAFARVLTAHPSARLRIIGQGPQRAYLGRLVTDLHLGEAVVFTGWLAPMEVEHQLRDAWALVAPSLWAEPLGLVALEAIVRGVPVVASTRGGFAETVEDGVSGLLVPNGDEEALAECLRAIVAGQAFPDHAVAATVVRRTAESHDVGRHIARIRRIFADVAGL